MSIFPNPGSGQTTIELSGLVNGQARLSILDLTGRNLHSEQMKASAHFAESFVDVSVYPSGTYLIQIQTKQGTYTQKYIKQ